MRRIREVLRLYFTLHLSLRQIARSARVSRSAVHDIVQRAQVAGLTAQHLSQLDDRTLEETLYVRPVDSSETARGKALPDWNWVHREMRKPGVTLRLLWEEFKAACPTGIGYSQFCARYRALAKSLNVTLHLTHRAGEAMMVDYSGDGLAITLRHSGEVRMAQVFVAVLPASDYLFADVTFTQGLEDFIASHQRALTFFGGVPKAVIVDNLRAGVSQANYYDPVLNPTYQDFAAHYGFAILPARVARPKDKAAGEAHVRIVQQSVLAPLRNRTFLSLADARRAVLALVHTVNHKPFQKLDGCRADLFQQIERAALMPLPNDAYEFATFSKHRVNLDYHVEVDHAYYSVPFRLAHREVEVRLTARTVEIFHQGERVASHMRATRKGEYRTEAEHMPTHHKAYMARTPDRLLEEARAVGVHTGQLCERILAARPHVEQGYRSVLGVLRLAKRYPSDRMERACAMCLALGILSSSGLRHILENRTEGLYDPAQGAPEAERTQGAHDNVRGADYYDDSKLVRQAGGEGAC